MVFTQSGLTKLESRQELYAELLADFQNSMTGDTVSILSLIRDKSGKYDEGKADELIDALVASAWIFYQRDMENRRKEWRRSTKAERMDFAPPEIDPCTAGTFSEVQNKFLRNYLYIALRIVDVNPYWNTRGCDQTLRSLEELLSTPYYLREHWQAKIAVAERYGMGYYREVSGIFGPAAFIIHTVTGKYLTDEDVKKTGTGFVRLLPSDFQTEMSMFQNSVKKCSEEMEKAWLTLDDLEDIPEYTPEEWELPPEKWERPDTPIRRDEEIERIRETFTDIEKFEQCYREFEEALGWELERNGPEGVYAYDDSNDEDLRMIYDMNFIIDFRKYIRGTLDIYAAENGLSRFMDDNSFINAMAALELGLKKLKTSDGRRAYGGR